MKKIVVCLLVTAVLLGVTATFFFNMPDFMLFCVAQDIQQDGLLGIEPYLSGKLQPVFQSVVKLSNQPWLVELLSDASTQALISLLNEKGTMTWQIEDMRRGRTTASCLVSVESDVFIAQISLEMVRQEGKWLIDGFTLPALDLK